MVHDGHNHALLDSSQMSIYISFIQQELHDWISQAKPYI